MRRGTAIIIDEQALTEKVSTEILRIERASRVDMKEDIFRVREEHMQNSEGKYVRL